MTARDALSAGEGGTRVVVRGESDVFWCTFAVGGGNVDFLAVVVFRGGT